MDALPIAKCCHVLLDHTPFCFVQDKACDAMELFDELVESEVSIVTPHLKALVEFCLQVFFKPFLIKYFN